MKSRAKRKESDMNIRKKSKHNWKFISKNNQLDQLGVVSDGAVNCQVNNVRSLGNKMWGTGVMLDTGYYNRNMAARAETIQPDIPKQCSLFKDVIISLKKGEGYSNRWYMNAYVKIMCDISLPTGSKVRSWTAYRSPWCYYRHKYHQEYYYYGRICLCICTLEDSCYWWWQAIPGCDRH